MPKRLFIDYARCNGCQICALHCSFVKTGTFNPGRSRIQINGHEEKGLYIPSVCLHCEEPPCIPACPERAISKDSENGKVSLDDDKCVGHLTCIPACPYGALTAEPSDNKALICDLCDGDPACARVCPIGVIKYLDVNELGQDEWQQHTESLANVLSSIPGVKEQPK